MFTAIVNSKATSKLAESWPVCTSPLIKSIIASQISSEKKKRLVNCSCVVPSSLGGSMDTCLDYKAIKLLALACFHQLAWSVDMA